MTVPRLEICVMSLPRLYVSRDVSDKVRSLCDVSAKVRCDVSAKVRSLRDVKAKVRLSLCDVSAKV